MISPGESGSGPSRKALRNALGVIGASMKQVKRRIQSGYHSQPRQVCKVCAKTFDFAVIAPGSVAQASLCGECKAQLDAGYTAVVSINPDAYAFLRHPSIRELSGKIVPVSKENFAKLKARYEETKNAGSPPPPPQAG